MDDNKTTSGWDELAKELGSDPTPESFQRQSRDTEPLPAARESEESQSVPQKDVPQANPNDWTGLANTLGIPVEERIPIEEPSAPEVSEGEAAKTEPESLASDSSALDGSDIHFEDETTDEDASEEESSPADGPSITSSDQAQSAFDALFLSGTAAAEACSKISSSDGTDATEGKDSGEDSDEDSGEAKKGRRPRRRRGRGRGRRNQGDQLEAAEDAVEEAAAAKDAVHSESDPFGGFLSPSATEQTGATENIEEERSSGDAEESDDRKKSQRRRRPRRRRGKGRGDAASDVENPVAAPEDALDISADADDDSPDDDSPDDDFSDDDSPDDDENLNSAISRSGKRPSHRNIPTWQEAMGMIVDTNMEARKKTPTKAGQSSSPRGRGRSGRPRKKT